MQNHTERFRLGKNKKGSEIFLKASTKIVMGPYFIE
jgi:hypothetical protein